MINITTYKEGGKMKNLLTIKQMLANDELLYIETHNKETGWIGCA